VNINISGGPSDGGGSDVLYRNLDCDTFVESTLQMVFYQFWARHSGH